MYGENIYFYIYFTHTHTHTYSGYTEWKNIERVEITFERIKHQRHQNQRF